MAQQAETTVAECTLALCAGACFQTCSHCGTVSPLRLHRVKGVCVFWWPWSFTSHCSNMGVDRTLTKSQQNKATTTCYKLLNIISRNVQGAGLGFFGGWSLTERGEFQQKGVLSLEVRCAVTCPTHKIDSCDTKTSCSLAMLAEFQAVKKDIKKNFGFEALST